MSWKTYFASKVNITKKQLVTSKVKRYRDEK
jgi:hypothetical protein